MTTGINTLPDGLTARPTVLEDLPGIAARMAAHEKKLDGAVDTTLEDLHIYYQSPRINQETDTLTIFNGERQVASIIMDQMEHARIDANFEVDPEYWGRGIEDYLFSWAEEWAHRQIALADPGVRVCLDMRISSKDAAWHDLYIQRGMRQIRSFWRMKISMQEPPETPIWPAGIAVRTFSPEMAYAVYEANEKAFKDHWGYMPHSFEEWKRWSMEREAFDPSRWFLAMDGERIAGFSLCALEGEDRSEGWVHDLGVLRPWRRHGLGLALLLHSFGEFYRQGIGEIYLGVDSESLTGAVRLYERAGMHVVRQFNRYEKELRAGKELSTQTVEG